MRDFRVWTRRCASGLKPKIAHFKILHFKISHFKVSHFKIPHFKISHFKNFKVRDFIKVREIKILQRKEDLSISVSDKGGEFVVLESDIQRQLTENHLSSSLGVYKPVPPTRKHLGLTRVIANPTNMSYR